MTDREAHYFLFLLDFQLTISTLTVQRSSQRGKYNKQICPPSGRVLDLDLGDVMINLGNLKVPANGEQQIPCGVQAPSNCLPILHPPPVSVILRMQTTSLPKAKRTVAFSTSKSSLYHLQAAPRVNRTIRKSW